MLFTLILYGISENIVDVAFYKSSYTLNLFGEFGIKRLFEECYK